MADLERTIDIIFNGDDRTSAAFSSVAGGLGALSDQVEAVAGKFASVADDILKVDAALLALAAGGLALAIVKAGEFNASTTEIQTLVHDASFDIGAYRESILNYAVDSTQSISAINAALYEAMSTGESWENSLNTLSAAEKLAVAGQGELSSSLLLLLQTMNAYGSTFDEATRYSDVFFKTVELGVIKIPELAEGLSAVTTMAANAGVPIETVGAAIADLTAKGMPAGEAITALRAIIKDLIEPAGTSAKAMDALGIEYGSSAIQAKGLEGVLLDMYNTTGGNIDQMAKFFGRIEGLNGALALTARDGGTSFLQKLEEMRNSAGSTAAAYDLMVQNFENINQRLVNTMEAAFITAGQPLLDDWAGLAASLGEVFKSLKISINAGAFADVYAMLEEFATKFSTYVSGIAQALPEALSLVDFTGITSAIRDLAGEFAKYLEGLDLTKPEDLAYALQKVADTIEALIRVTSGMVEGFRPFAEAIVDFITKLAASDEQAQKSFGNFLAAAEMISKAGLEIALALATLGQTGMEWGDAFEVSVNAVKFVWNAFTIGFEAGALAVTAAAWTVLKAMDSITFHQSDYLQEQIRLVEGDMLKLYEAIKLDAAEGANAFDGLLSGLDRMITATVQETEEAKQLAAELDAFPESRFIEIQTQMNLAEQDAELAAFTEARFIDIIPRISTAELAAEQAAIDRWASEAKYIGIIPKVDPNAQADVDKALASKEIEWSAKLDIAKVEANAKIVTEQLETIQNSVEWRAKLDISEVEANADIIEAAFGAIESAFTSSGEIISSAVGALSKYDEVFDITGNRNFLKGVIEEELGIRERAMDATEALIAKQIEFMDAKLLAMSKGQAMIQIDGAGLQPHLEAFMWEILSAIQVRVNEEGHAMLFGL